MTTELIWLCFFVKFSGATYGKPSVERLDESNKGHQMLKKMGWGGAGLGVKEQGIEQPITGGEVGQVHANPQVQASLLKHYVFFVERSFAKQLNSQCSS